MQNKIKKLTSLVLIGIIVTAATVTFACGGKPHCTPTPPVVVTPPTPPTPPSSGGGGSSGSMLNPCQYFPNPTSDCQTTPSQQYQWNNPIIREQIMDAWRCRTFGTDCLPPQPVTKTTPAEIYGK